MVKTTTAEVTVLNLDTFQASQLPELQGKKESLLKLVNDNPFVEVIDNETYEIGKKRRTAQRTGRTDLEKEKKLVMGRIKEVVLKRVESEYDELILIPQGGEIKQQESVAAWEERKENERKEKQRIEELRIETAKAKISEWYDFWNGVFTTMQFTKIGEITADFEKAHAEFDRASLLEFGVLFDSKVDLLTDKLTERTGILNAAEANRLEEVRLEGIRLDNIRLDKIETGRRAQLAQYSNFMHDLQVQVYQANLNSSLRDYDDDQFIGLVSRLEAAKVTAETEAKLKSEAAAKLKADQEKFEAEKLAFRTEIRTKEVSNLGFSFEDKGEAVGILFTHDKLGYSYSKYVIDDSSEDAWNDFVERVKAEIALISLEPTENTEVFPQEMPDNPDPDYIGSDPILEYELIEQNFAPEPEDSEMNSGTFDDSHTHNVVVDLWDDFENFMLINTKTEKESAYVQKIIERAKEQFNPPTRL